MADLFQNKAPEARINLTSALSARGAQRKDELSLKLPTAGAFSKGWKIRLLSKGCEGKKASDNKNNVNGVLSEFSPEENLTVQIALAGNSSEGSVKPRDSDMKVFEPEQFARQIPQLRAMPAMHIYRGFTPLSPIENNLNKFLSYRIAAFLQYELFRAIALVRAGFSVRRFC